MTWTWLPDLGLPLGTIVIIAYILTHIVRALIKIILGLVIALFVLYIVASQGLIALPFEVPTPSEIFGWRPAGFPR
jgi:hypothetical protein